MKLERKFSVLFLLRRRQLRKQVLVFIGQIYGSYPPGQTENIEHE